MQIHSKLQKSSSTTTAGYLFIQAQEPYVVLWFIKKTLDKYHCHNKRKKKTTSIIVTHYLCISVFKWTKQKLAEAVIWLRNVSTLLAIVMWLDKKL